MIHMLSAFDLADAQALDDFAEAYAGFLADLKRDDLIVSAGPLGERVADTPMDTDDARDHRYYSVMTFRDRAQLDAAYARIVAKTTGATGAHQEVMSKVADTVFTCWRDLG